MSEASSTIEWNDNLEKYIAGISEQCYGYSLLHKASEARFAFLRNILEIPGLILSVIAGSASVGAESLFPKTFEYSSVCVGSVVLLTSCMASINSYFRFSSRCESHRISSLLYNKEYRFLSLQLQLPRKDRIDAGKLIEQTREEINRLNEISNLIPETIIKEFKHKFDNEKYKNVVKPAELNGLQIVNIYRETGNDKSPGFTSPQNKANESIQISHVRS